MGFPPTAQQRALIDALARFCDPDSVPNRVFLLNGYAGTGKTSVVAALVRALAAIRRPTVLLAPTGRAAKVLADFSGRRAQTIHRKIYRGDLVGTPFTAGVGENPHRNAIFIVDEASMIGEGSQGEPSLLDDLVSYVYGSGEDCRMILLGDTAQLPPVGSDRSPAMNPGVLKAMGLDVSRAIITETVRQKHESGILMNATALRKAMSAAAHDPGNGLPVPELYWRDLDDVRLTTQEDLEDDLAGAYSRHGVGETILITRSNRRAMLFNLAIRSRILEKEEVITRDEPLMVCRNNYFWKTGIRGADFIANGDIVVVSKIHGFENRGFLRFADVELTLPDHDGVAFDAKLILSTLNSETAGLPPDYEQMLLEQTLRQLSPADAADPYIRARVLRADPYFNALRVKYSYAVTCHKAQGGQWESVFADMAGISDEATRTPEFYRWLYTAVTRATRRLTFISPSATLTKEE